MWFFSSAHVSVVRRTNSSVGRSGNQEYKEKALWKWGWIWEVGKDMGKGKAMEENTSAKCQRRDRSVVRGNALAEECQTCKKCFDMQKRLSFLANQLKGCGRGCERSSGFKEGKLSLKTRNLTHVWKHLNLQDIYSEHDKCSVILIWGDFNLQGWGKASSVSSASRLRWGAGKHCWDQGTNILPGSLSANFKGQSYSPLLGVFLPNSLGYWLLD